jgi:hypothetical protein
MYQTYLVFSRVPEPWHGLQVGYIQPRADISDALDISDHRSGSGTVAARSGQIYPTRPKSAHLDSEFKG